MEGDTIIRSFASLPLRGSNGRSINFLIKLLEEKSSAPIHRRRHRPSRHFTRGALALRGLIETHRVKQRARPTRRFFERWYPRPELNWNQSFRKRRLYPFELRGQDDAPESRFTLEDSVRASLLSCSKLGVPAAKASPHQPVPRAPQGFLESQNRRQENVEIARFDFLNGADVQIHQLGKPQLRELPRHTLAPNVLSESLQPRLNLAALGHAPLRRMVPLTKTA